MAVNYYLNKDKRSKLKEKAIFCYIRVSSKTFTLHIDERIEPKHWDVKSQKAKKSYIGHPELNDYLIRYKEKIKEIIRNARQIDPLMPFDQVKQIILKEVKNKSEIDFFQVFDLFIETRKPIVSKGTTTKFNTMRKHIKDFCEKTNYQIELDTIDLSFFDQLHNYFLTIGISNNTIHKDMQFVKSFLRWAFEREYTKNINLKIIRTFSKRRLILLP